MSWLLRAIEPHIDVALLPADGERVIDEVRRHWLAGLFPGIRMLLGMWLLIAAFLFSNALFWVLLTAAVAVILQAAFRVVAEFRDRFVITTQKVFRVHGVLNTQRASMPLTKILDITVQKPLMGRLCGFGHFIFESAAQDQGLREIRFVPHIDQRERTIQEVINRAGLRNTSYDHEQGDGT